MDQTNQPTEHRVHPIKHRHRTPTRRQHQRWENITTINVAVMLLVVTIMTFAMAGAPVVVMASHTSGHTIVAGRQPQATPPVARAGPVLDDSNDNDSDNDDSTNKRKSSHDSDTTKQSSSSSNDDDSSSSTIVNDAELSNSELTPPNVKLDLSTHCHRRMACAPCDDHDLVSCEHNQSIQ
jgi:hypothetical protein